MRVCLVCVEFFGWGKFGGFGRATRMISRELARRGVDAYVAVPRRPGQAPVSRIDRVTVVSYPAGNLRDALATFRGCDADVYHSQETSLGTYLAMRAMPDRRHVITFRDHKMLGDWLVELRYPSRSRLSTLLAWLYERNPLVTSAVRRADRLFCCAPHLAQPIARLYGLSGPPPLLGTPVPVPGTPPAKSRDPLVVFLARWDRRKRPQLFFELAKAFPRVRFIAFGRSQDAAWDVELRRRYGGLPNLELAGFVDQFEDGRVRQALDRAWVLVNTAAREGLPTSFLEAMAHRCALLARVDPGQVVDRFGFCASADNFAEGLEALLQGDAWRAKGEAAYGYMREHFELDRVIERHIELYRELAVDGHGRARG